MPIGNNNDPMETSETSETSEASDASEISDSIMDCDTDIPVPETLPDLQQSMLTLFFQNIYLIDRVRLDQVYPRRLNAFTHHYFRDHCAKFEISIDAFKKYTGLMEFNKNQFTEELRELLECVAKYITHLKVDYTSLLQWPTVIPVITTLIQENCLYLVKLHVVGVGFVWDRCGLTISPVPKMEKIEAFIYDESFESKINQDPMITSFLLPCNKRLESLSIFNAHIDGSCLKTPKDLRYLHMKNNYTMLEENDNDARHMHSEVRLEIGQLVQFCKSTTVRHLELEQLTITEKDVATIITMPLLSHLELRVLNSTTTSMNKCLQGLVRIKDKLIHLDMRGYGQREFELNMRSLQMLERFVALRELSLGGAVHSPEFVQTMDELTNRNVDVYYFNTRGERPVY